MILVRFHGYPGTMPGETIVHELWVSRVPQRGEALVVNGARLRVEDVETDLTGVEVSDAGTTIGMNIDVKLTPERSWAAKRYPEPPALT